MASFLSPDGALERILIVDDDIIIRGVLRALLTKLGRIAEAVSDTDEAWQILSASRFDLVILDLNIPTRGGLHLCRELRASHTYDEVPIVILTALDNFAARTDCVAAGATLFVAKPFTPAEILRQLQPFLRLKPADLVTLGDIARSDRGIHLQDASAARLRVDLVSP